MSIGINELKEIFSVQYGFGYANTEPRAREWIRKAATCDYHGINKMALENPALVRRKDVNVSKIS